MYKFYGKPLQKVTSAITGDIVFRFDTKGEFITDDPNIYERTIGKFDHKELTITQGEKVEKTFPDIKLEISEPKILKCKKCDFTCTNQGDLLAHYRAEHKKGE